MIKENGSWFTKYNLFIFDMVQSVNKYFVYVSIKNKGMLYTPYTFSVLLVSLVSFLHIWPETLGFKVC